MGNIKLTSLLQEEKKKKVDEQQLNEFAGAEVALMTTLGTLITLAAEVSTGAFSPDGKGIIGSTIDNLRDAYVKATKLKPILDKLDKDPEVQQFIEDNIRKMANMAGAYNGQKWHEVIDKKLTDKEKQYAGKIWATDIPSYKTGDKDAIIAKHDAALKQKAKDKKAAQKQAAKVGNVDLDQKIKNPETDNDISLKSALGYDKDSVVYKAAVQKIQKDKGNDGEQKPQEPVKGASMFDKKYKDKR